MEQVQQPVGRSCGGFSVTIPHKEHALRWLLDCGNDVSPLARRCGAVNTLVRTSAGGFRGENTDATAAWAVLADGARDIAAHPSDANVLILGAGGAARGIAAGLMEHGCRVQVTNRTAERARVLCAALGCAFVDWSERGATPADVIVNCTSVGMRPNIDETPFPPEALRAGQIVFDTVYAPEETRLRRDAAAAGCRLISGRTMFLEQASEQSLLWQGETAATHDPQA
jgi:3-dehydroquinate dehydratase/shikimate dehydrogenase